MNRNKARKIVEGMIKELETDLLEIHAKSRVVPVSEEEYNYIKQKLNALSQLNALYKPRIDEGKIIEPRTNISESEMNANGESFDGMT